MVVKHAKDGRNDTVRERLARNPAWKLVAEYRRRLEVILEGTQFFIERGLAIQLSATDGGRKRRNIPRSNAHPGRITQFD